VFIRTITVRDNVAWIQGIDVGDSISSTTIHQFYYYTFNFFAKGKEVTYKERVILSQPTTWTFDEEGIDYADNTTPGYEVSEDKTTITVTRTVPNDAFVFDGWSINNDDPKGPFKIEILFQDKVVRTFDYIVE
jgi:hypothetical protein